METSKRTVPVVALRGSVVFPHTEAILTFGRPRSRAAVNSAFQGDRVLAVFTQKDARVANPEESDLYSVGTVGTIQQLMPTDGELHVLIRGVARIKLSEIVSLDPFIVAKIEEIPEVTKETDEEKALAKNITELFKKAVNLGKPAEIMVVMRLLSGQVEAAELADQIASLLDLKISQKQELLSQTQVFERLKKIKDLLSHEVNILELEQSISSKTQKRFEEQMRKAMLREKKRTIEEELGELEEGKDEVSELRAQIRAAGMPLEVLEKAEKELERLVQMSPHNPEGGYIRNYLDWMVAMPWNKQTPNNVSIQHAAKILEDDHYGLARAKERILEFLAVMKLKGQLSGARRAQKVKKEEVFSPTILCFIGPPGVGKTSIGRSIARSLGRKFIRVSLGGIRDEAEIRGHRRTYVGALPGRIIQGIKNAGTKNPVFMLDEIDKVGIDFRGDPSAALLEALDPEQNKEFSDHYLEVPFDLSQVMFICTGNMLDTIPPALRDRLEVIRFPGYTEEEKYQIARQFLWPKQVRAHGLEDLQLEISPLGLREIINRYTREAGVRELERNIATMFRKIARKVTEGKKIKRAITVSDVHQFLGPQKFTSLFAERRDEVGMATGLAVTPTGGEILFVEVALMPGKGKLTLTGQLGEVMQESAKAAFSYARSHWQDLGLKQNFSQNLDVHIHVPEGAVPKDGPSAGIAIATALISALNGNPTRREVGMTGEITLRGRVLEIGGIKEKVIAAHTAGIKTVVLPRDNKKDLEDIPEKVKRDIKFVFVSRIEDVLKEALKKPSTKEIPRDGEGRRARPVYLATS